MLTARGRCDTTGTATRASRAWCTRLPLRRSSPEPELEPSCPNPDPNPHPKPKPQPTTKVTLTLNLAAPSPDLTHRPHRSPNPKGGRGEAGTVPGARGPYRLAHSQCVGLRSSYGLGPGLGLGYRCFSSALRRSQPTNPLRLDRISIDLGLSRFDLDLISCAAVCLSQDAEGHGGCEEGGRPNGILRVDI